MARPLTIRARHSRPSPARQSFPKAHLLTRVLSLRLRARASREPSAGPRKAPHLQIMLLKIKGRLSLTQLKGHMSRVRPRLMDAAGKAPGSLRAAAPPPTQRSARKPHPALSANPRTAKSNHCIVFRGLSPDGSGHGGVFSPHGERRGEGALCFSSTSVDRQQTASWNELNFSYQSC